MAIAGILYGTKHALLCSNLQQTLWGKGKCPVFNLDIQGATLFTCTFISSAFFFFFGRPYGNVQSDGIQSSKTAFTPRKAQLCTSLISRITDLTVIK